MINSIPAPVITAANPEIIAGQELLADRARDQFLRAPVEQTLAARAFDPRADDRESRAARGSGDVPGRTGFLDTAKQMIGGALADFRHDLGKSLESLGFPGRMAGALTAEVMGATRDALFSEADFSVNLMMAAVTRSVSVAASGTSASFSLTARSVEISVNHTTGEISVSTTSLSIENHVTEAYGAAPPSLLDMVDSDRLGGTNLTDLLLARQDFADLLDEDIAAENAAEDGDRSPEFLPPAFEAPGMASAPDSRTRIFVTAFEHRMNERQERVTLLRFDARVPLASAAAPPPETPVPPPMRTGGAIRV